MVVRRLVSTLLMASFAPAGFGLQACGGTTENAASQLVKSPEMPVSDQETRCKVRKSQAEPLIVEWPNAQRGRLESVSKRNLVAIKYNGCELEQLTGCTVKTSVGNYAYWPITRKQSKVAIHNADELYANMPVGAVSLEGKLKTAGQLEVNMTIVGRYEAPTHTFYKNDLEGQCEGATHVIAALTTGAFTFSAGGDAEVGGGVTVGNAGAGGKSQSKKETLQSDGDETACARATNGDKTPPEGCGALLQIEVTALQPGLRAAVAPVVVAPAVIPVTPPVEPPPVNPPVAEKPTTPPKKPPKCKKGERVEDGVCVKVGTKKPATKPPMIAGLGTACSSGQHREGSKCVEDVLVTPAEPPPEPKPITRCGYGMRLEGDHCVSIQQEPTPVEPPPDPTPAKRTPVAYEAPSRPAEEPNPLRATLGYVGIGLGLTALTAGIVALSAAKTAADECPGGTCSSEGESKKTTAVVAAVIADVALGLTVAAYITVLVLPKTTKISVNPSTHGATIGAWWRW